MKKLYISIIAILIIFSILVFPGCGGGGGNHDGTKATGLKIYEVSGGSAYMPNLNQSGLVFADSLTEIGNEYVVFVGNNSESAIPTIQAYYYDTEGKKIDTPVMFEKSVSADDCFNIENPSDITGGGSQFQLTGNSPGGKGKLVASANGVSKEIDVYVFDSYGTLGGGNGIELDNTGKKSNPSSIRANCAFFQESDGSGVKIVSNSLFVENCTISDWKEKLKAVKTITDSEITGAVDQVITNSNPAIYIAKVPGGGYIKVVKVGQSIAWAYAPPGATSFK